MTVCVISALRTFTVAVVSAPDIVDPLVTAYHGEGLGNRFVERLGSQVERMRGVVQVMDNDGAGFERHEGNSSYSPSVRLTPQFRTAPL